MVEKNITLLEISNVYEGRKNSLLKLNISEFTIIAENMVSVNRTDFKYYKEHYIHEKGTHAILHGYLQLPDLKIAPMEKWWKSKESVPGKNSYVNYPTRKNWIMNKVL